MNWSLIITIVLILDILAFAAYEYAVLTYFCIPNNLSNTYYHFDRRFRGYGKLFPTLLYFLSVTALPIWTYFTWRLPDWRAYGAIMPILAAICLTLVGLSARYKKSDFRIYFHYTVAIMAGFFTVLWFLTVGYRVCYFLISFIFIMIVIGALTRTIRIYPLFWFESAGFFAVLFMLLTVSLVPTAL